MRKRHADPHCTNHAYVLPQSRPAPARPTQPATGKTDAITHPRTIAMFAPPRSFSHQPQHDPNFPWRVQRSSKLLSAARQASAAMTGVRLNDGELSAKLGPRSCSGPPGCLRRLSASHPCHHGRLLPTVWTAQAYPRAGRQLASSPAQARWLGRRVRGDAHRWPRSSTGMRELVGDLPRQQASLGEGGGDGLAGAVPYGRLTCRRAEGRRNLLVRWLPLTDWPVPLRKGRGCWGPALGVVVSLRVEAPSPIPPW